MEQSCSAATRRTVLAAGLLLPLLSATGCTSSSRPGPPPAPDPDVALRAAALAREQHLLDLYDAALAAGAVRPAPSQAVLVALRAEHATHLHALVATAPAGTPSPGPTSASAGPSASAPAPSAADLRLAEAQAATAHVEAVLPASRRLAALLATLSAAEAAHAVALA